MKSMIQLTVRLQTLLQSYQNVSNSQLFSIISNNNIAANAFAKLSKCQQFTTLPDWIRRYFQLQTLLQSYQNVSNSQLIIFRVWSVFSCKRFCKVIKMLAIHNAKVDSKKFSNAANAFAKLSKCQQFTTSQYQITVLLLLQTLLQSYQNVSNSQHCCRYTLSAQGCKRFCKVIKMLAIHNIVKASNKSIAAANAFAKLSKCQQFTTILLICNLRLRLQTLLQSYQNVSNSQLCCKYPAV